MAAGEWINVIGTMVTIAGALVTIVYAQQAKTAKFQIDRKYRKIFLSEVRSLIEETQRLGRKMQESLHAGSRGVRLPTLTQPIRHQMMARSTGPRFAEKMPHCGVKF